MKKTMSVINFVVGSLFALPIVQGANPVQIENALPGTSAWRLTNSALNHEIEGYASLTSVNAGGQISFFVSTADPTYQVEIYRMGWYGGLGGRQVMSAIQLPGIQQATPVPDQFATLECNWVNPYTFSIPTSWVSGFYLAKLTGSSGKQSYIIFVVRNDAYSSALLFMSPANTWQAYNNWGGISHYGFNSESPYVGYAATKVSFNRPYARPRQWTIATLGVGAGEFLNNFQDETYPTGWEYNMVRFLEREGYDVTYCTDVDVKQNTNLPLSHKALLIDGHSEYWSTEMRSSVINARDQGVNLAVFGANTCYVRIFYETSPITGAADRTVNFDNPTMPWRSLNMPESTFIGVMYLRDPVNIPLKVVNTSHWVFAGTGLRDGDQLSGLVGYEADAIFGPGTGEWSNSSPANIIMLGDSVNPSNNDHYNMSIYTAASGAMVFATGSMHFNWGLDDDYNIPAVRPSVLSPAAQQIARNVFNRFTLGQGISVTVSPSTATLYASQSQQFTASVQGSTNTGVNWTLSPAGVGSISNAGLYIAPSAISTQQTVTLTATAAADSTKTATATINLFPPITVTVNPTNVNLTANQTQQFTATVTNATNTNVNWTLIPAVGTISSAGSYSAPSVVNSTQTVTVKATSAADGTTFGQATVTLAPSVQVQVSLAPPSTTLIGGGSQQITATVTNASNTSVTWNISPSGIGSFTTTATTFSYTAPAVIAANQVLTVTATSVADTSKAATATITLVPVSISINPVSTSLYGSGSQQFTATVANAGNTAVTWNISPSGVGAFTTTATTLSYTAPASIAAQQTLTVTATSVADTTKSVNATITLNPPAGGFGNGYGYQRSITIAHAKAPNTDQSNFPVLVEGVYPYLATVANGGRVQNSSGYDIIFTSDSAGSNLLSWEIESYNASTGSVVFWVKLPTVSHTADTVFYIFYGNSKIATFQGNKSGTWGSNYAAVYHMADSAANPNVADSTSRGNTGTAQANTSGKTATGEISRALSFDGSTDYIGAGAGSSFNILGNITIEAWINVNSMPSVGEQAYVCGRGYNGEHESYFLRLETGDDGTNYVEAGTFNFPDPYLAQVAVSGFTGGWHHVVGTFDGQWNIYVDGVKTTSAQTLGPLPTNEPFLIGARDANGGTLSYLNGRIDEVRVSNIARSADWISTEYNNQSNPSTFYTVGPEQH
jgi:Concanavalin A-like lectin/glucanases superfamily/Domain of unknown function (DUF2341)